MRNFFKEILKKLKSKKVDLLIYDTIFPNPVSGFRMAEFLSILTHYKKSEIIVEPLDYHVLNLLESQHNEDLHSLKKRFPLVSEKTTIGSPKSITSIYSKLFYCVFLNIIYDCLPYLEKSKKDFVFTLYPGGGFNIKDLTALEKLRKVLQSNHFKGVIVTQEFTKNFLIEKYNCPEEKIHYIFGGIIPQYSIDKNRNRIYKKEKTLNICFCAAKYMDKGLDKGYDLFIDAGKILLSKNYNVKFSIIGGYNANDIPLHGYFNSFKFYGYKKYEELSEIFQNQDIIVSPNRPFTLNNGSFDGFPLGAVVEAALNGVVPIVTDELYQNSHFTESELIIIKPNVLEIVNSIERLLNNEEIINKMSQDVQLKCRKIYSHSNQLNERIKILDKYIYD